MFQGMQKTQKLDKYCENLLQINLSRWRLQTGTTFSFAHNVYVYGKCPSGTEAAERFQNRWDTLHGRSGREKVRDGVPPKEVQGLPPEFFGNFRRQIVHFRASWVTERATTMEKNFLYDWANLVEARASVTQCFNGSAAYALAVSKFVSRWWRTLLVMGACPCRGDHITLVLQQLHWLLVRQRVVFKIAGTCISRTAEQLPRTLLMQSWSQPDVQTAKLLQNVLHFYKKSIIYYLGKCTT